MKKLYPKVAVATVMKTVLTAIAGILISTNINAQTTGDYRTKATGNWNALTTWERYQAGTGWVQPTVGQGTPDDGDGAITILNTHTVTLTASVGADQFIISAGGQLTINTGITLTVETGTGTDLTVNGTLLNSGMITIATGFPTGATAGFGNGSVYKHNQTGGTIPTATWNTNATLEFSNGGTTAITAPNLGPLKVLVTNNTAVTVSGTTGTQTLDIAAGTGTDLQVNSGSSLTFNSNYENLDLNANATSVIDGTLRVNGAFVTSSNGTSTTVNGKFIYGGSQTGMTAAKFAVAAGAVFNCAIDAGAIPAANWNPQAILEFDDGGSIAVTSPNIGPIKVLVTNNTTVTMSGTAGAQTLDIGAGTGTDLQINSGSSLTLNGNYENLELNTNATAVIDGTLRVNGAFVTTDNGTSTTVNGTFIYAGSQSGITPAKFTVASGGTFEHAINGGTVPTATWSTGSTLKVTGLTDADLGGMSQAFYHVLFQNVLTDNVTLGAALNIQGNLTISNTGGANDELRISNDATDRIAAVAGNVLLTSGNFILVDDDGDVTFNVAGNFTQSGGTFRPKDDNGNVIINIAGNLTVSNGTFDQNAIGAGAATIINVTGNFALSNGTFDMSGTNGFSGVMNLRGNYTHSGGTLTETATGNGTFNFVGDKLHNFSSAGTASNTINYTVETGDTLQFDLAATLVSGAGTFNAQSGSTVGIRHTQGISTSGTTGAVRTTGRTYSPGANYIYNGSAAQATGTGLTGAANLTIANSGPAAVTITNNNVNVTGTLLISSGTLALGTNTMLVGGNWTNNGGSLTATGAGNVVMNGTALQTIGGTIATTFNNLNLNKTAGTVALAQNMNMAGTLNIGVNLDLATYILTMSAASPTIGTLGAGSFSATKMIIASGGGELRKTLSAAGAVAFPIGDNTGVAEYSPVGILFTGGTYAGYVSAKVADVKHPDNGNNDLTGNYLTRYWTITQSGLSGFSALVGLNYVDADVVNDENNIRMGKWNGTAPWVRFDPSITPASNLLNATVSSFSDFTGINLLEALPVKLNNFTATLVDKSADLAWTTAEEINSSHYDVEHSTDGVNFKTLSVVSSKNSQTGSAYAYRHLTPTVGKNYYRLKMVDVDEKFEYSPIIMLKYSGPGKQLSAYPNPAVDNVTIRFEKVTKAAFIRVVDMQGRILNSIVVPAGSTLMQVKLNGYSRGIYNIVYEIDGEKTIHRIQKN